jgi:hypothetical protein
MLSLSCSSLAFHGITSESHALRRLLCISEQHAPGFRCQGLRRILLCGEAGRAGLGFEVEGGAGGCIHAATRNELLGVMIFDVPARVPCLRYSIEPSVVKQLHR